MYVCPYFISLTSIIQEKEPDFQLDLSFMEKLPWMNMSMADLIKHAR